MHLWACRWGESRALPLVCRPAQRSFKAPFSSAPDDPNRARRSSSALAFHVAPTRRFTRSGEDLRHLRAVAHVNQEEHCCHAIADDPVLEWGGRGARRGAVVLTHALHRQRTPARYVPSPSSRPERRASTSTCSSGLCSMTSAAPQPPGSFAFTPGAAKQRRAGAQAHRLFLCAVALFI